MKRFSVSILVLAAMTLVGTGWAGLDKQEPQLRLELDLVDGSHIIGIPSIESVPVQTSYAKIDVPLTQIMTVVIDKDHETASLSLQNGDKLKGVINLEPIKLETAFGKVTVGIEHIREFRVVLSGGPLPDALKQGLVLYYSFDGDEGGKVTDKSGNGHDGEVCAAIWTPNGKIGGAYQVGKQVGPIYRRRGTAPPKWVGHIQAPDNDAWSFGTKPFSICLWFKFSTPPGGEQDFIGHNEGLGERSKWAFQMQNGNLDFHINNSSRENYRIAAYPWSPQTDRYYHLSVTRNGDTYSIYVDGTRVSIDTNTLPIPVAKAPLTIGQAEGLYVEGVIDEVMIFNRALSQDEVKQIYQSVATLFTPYDSTPPATQPATHPTSRPRDNVFSSDLFFMSAERSNDAIVVKIPMTQACWLSFFNGTNTGHTAPSQAFVLKSGDKLELTYTHWKITAMSAVSAANAELNVTQVFDGGESGVAKTNIATIRLK